jgi:hypothetical protein
MLQGAVRLLSSSQEMEAAIRTAKQPEDEWHPLFVEALQRESYIEYLLDILCTALPKKRQALVAEQRKEVMKLEQRFAEHPD